MERLTEQFLITWRVDATLLKSELIEALFKKWILPLEEDFPLVHRPRSPIETCKEKKTLILDLISYQPGI